MRDGISFELFRPVEKGTGSRAFGDKIVPQLGLPSGASLMPVEAEPRLIRELIVEEVGLGLRQQPHGAVDGRRLSGSPATGAALAWAELSTNCRVGPVPDTFFIALEVIEATLDRLHLDHELGDMLAVSRTHLALLRVAMASALLPRVPRPVAGTAGRLDGSRRTHGSLGQ